jgi:hypothetical protein
MQAGDTSLVKATAIVQPAAAPSSANNARANVISYDDDDDVRSGKNEIIQRPKTSGPMVRTQQQADEPSPQKELTPKEKMIMNKLKKADEEAAKVG